MTRPTRSIAAAAAALLATAAVMPAASQAASTRTCKLSLRESQRMGPDYVATTAGRTTFRVRGVSCVTGKRVIRSFHACRLKHGATGRCRSRVRGFRCTDRRSSRLVLGGRLQQFEGDVTCKKGRATVSHHYTQRV